MKNYKITVSYDGTKYSGWQKQGNTNNTIQGKIENILSKMTGQDVEIFGSGRTDAGAHAKKQIANFKIDTDKTDEEILSYINEYLPNDIAINSIEQVDLRFHSRLNAKTKTYLYRINTTGIPNVFEKNFVYNIKTNVDVDKMRKASKNFIGEHDFLPFCSNKKTKKARKRGLHLPSFTIDHLRKIKFAYILYSFFYVKFLLFLYCVIV